MTNKTIKRSATEALLPQWVKEHQHSVNMDKPLVELNVPLSKNRRRLTKDIGINIVGSADTQEPIAFTVEEIKSVHWPVFIIGFSLIQIVFFYFVDSDDLLMLFGYDPYRRHEVWRFFTVAAVHANYSHLWNNLEFQLILGVFLESVHGWKRVTIIYLGSVLGGSLFLTVFDNLEYSCGASGGVYGLVSSHLAAMLLNWNEMDKPFIPLFCLLFLIAKTVGQTIYEELYLRETSDTSHAGHVGGVVIGFLVSMLVVKFFQKHRWGDTLQKICVGILLTIVSAILIFNVAATEAYLPTEWNFEYEESYYNHLSQINFDSDQ